MARSRIPSRLLRRPGAPRPGHGLRRAVAAIISLFLLTIAVAVLLLPARHPSPLPALVIPAAAQVRPPAPAARPTSTVTFAQGCLTSECHASLAATPYTHAPVAKGRCQDCHQPDAGNHTYPVLASLSERCLSCHASIQHAGGVHLARPDVDCLSCHAPHGSPQPSLLSAKSLGESCALCHAAGRQASVHSRQAAGRCDLCHAVHSTTTAAESCQSCHQQRLTPGDGAHTGHTAIPGACAACHQEHARFLTPAAPEAAAEACLTCHRPIAEALRTAPDAGVTRAACLTCHDPHSAARPSMLRADQPTLCLTCHKDPLKRADGTTMPAVTNLNTPDFRHSPVHAGLCSDCHTGHGGNHTARFDLTAFRSPQGPFKAENSQVCFNCHDRALATSDGPATQFRAGPRNLHRVHLDSGERSRSCSGCHAPHGSPNPRLIADSARYDGSDWTMKLSFTLTPDGGTCTSQCHPPMSYSRTGGPPAPPGAKP